MSYRKRPYRDKKDEVLAESEKLRKDIANLENALALHTRYQLDDKDSIRGLIRQEIGGSRWEYGAEGKLTTFRSGQDLLQEGQKRMSRMQSKADKAQPKSSRVNEKTKKNGKQIVRSDMGDSQNTGTYVDEEERLESSIENIAKLINDTGDISNTPDLKKIGQDNNDKTSVNYHSEPKDSSAVKIDSLKSKVLTRASINVIKRDTSNSSNLKDKRTLCKDASKKAEKINPKFDQARTSVGVVNAGDESSHCPSLDNTNHKTPHNRNRLAQKKLDASETVHHQSAHHSCLSEAKDTNLRTLKQQVLNRRDDASDSKWAHSMHKNIQASLSSEHHRNSLSDTPDQKPPLSATNLNLKRPPSPSQKSKSNLLFSLYGEQHCKADEILQQFDFSSSLNKHKTSPADLKPNIHGGQDRVPQFALDSSLGGTELNDFHILLNRETKTTEDLQLSASSSASYGTARKPLSYQDSGKKVSQMPCDLRVREWLDGLGLQSVENYSSLFAEHQMDMASVLLLTPDALREMGVQALGPIMKIMKGVHILNREGSTDLQIQNVEKKHFPERTFTSDNQNDIDNNGTCSKAGQLPPTKAFVDGKHVTSPLISEVSAISTLAEKKLGSPEELLVNEQAPNPSSSSRVLHTLAQKTIARAFPNSSEKEKNTQNNFSLSQAIVKTDEEDKCHQLTFHPKHSHSDDISFTEIGWEQDSKCAEFVNSLERSAIKEDVKADSVETVAVKERPSSGRKSRKQDRSKNKEVRSKVTRKPPVSSRIADTGVSAASQRASAKQKKQQEKERAEQEAVVVQRLRRDEMAAKHVQRRSSSADRSKTCRTSQRSTLHRSASFTDDKDTVQESSKSFSQPSNLEGILTGRGLDTYKSSNQQNASSRETYRDAVDKIDDIIVALQKTPRDKPASGLPPKVDKSKQKHKSSRTRSPDHHADMTLGAVRELQTRLSCLEEQLAFKAMKVGDEGSTRDISSDVAKRQDNTSQSMTFGSTSEKKNKYLPGKEKKIQVKERKKMKETENESDADYLADMLSSASLAQAESSKSVIDSKATQHAPAFADYQQKDKEVSSPHSATEVSTSHVMTESVSQTTATSDTLPVNAHSSLSTTAKQGKGHYYGVKKGGFNFQPVPRPPEMGVSYHKDSHKQAELKKEDISYSEDDLCGEGAFSQVFRGNFKGTEVAIKRLKAPLLPRDKNYFLAEVSMLLELRHPRVVMLLGVCSTDSLPLVVLEYMSCGNLHSLLHDTHSSTLSDVEFYQICHDVASGLLYLHSHQPSVLHLDLKPRNVLLSSGNRAKVADFGFSKLKHEADMKVSRLSKSRLMHSIPSWMAPELLVAGEITTKADVYSFGILLWEMYTREMPYAGSTVFQILEQVRRNKRPPVPQDCPAGLGRLIQQCWDQNPAARPKFKNILKTLEQLAETDSWSKLPCSSSNTKSSSEALDLGPGIFLKSRDDVTDSNAENGDPLRGVSVDLDHENTNEIKIGSASIGTGNNNISPSNMVHTSDVQGLIENIETPASPEPTAFELETKTGLTTLYLHTATQQPQTDRHENSSQSLPVASATSSPTVGQTSSLPANESCISKNEISSLPVEKSSTSDSENIEKHENRKKSQDFPPEMLLPPGICKLPKSESVVSQSHDNEQTAKDLIAKYLPPKKSASLVSKSFEQHSSTGTLKKLLPLRHSLDKPKRKSPTNISDLAVDKLDKSIKDFEMSNTKGVAKIEENTSSSRKYILRAGKSISPREGTEKLREKSMRVTAHEHASMLKSSTNLSHLRKQGHPPYANGQPYVPSFYSEIQQLNAGKRRPKLECSPFGANRKIDTSNLQSKSNFDSCGKNSVEEDFEAQSAFMKSLNKSTVGSAARKLQENTSSCKILDGDLKSPEILSDQRLPYPNAKTAPESPLGSWNSSPAQLSEEEQKIADEKTMDHLHELRLNIHSSDTGGGEGNDDSDDQADFSSSSSVTPDGISLDSLSLSNDGDTVVDSLELPDNSSGDDLQGLCDKESSKTFSIDLPYSASAETKISMTKKTKQMATRQSFFLFDESETNAPFDKLKSVNSYDASLAKETISSKSASNKSRQQPLSRSSNARQRAREKRVSEMTCNAETENALKNDPKTTKTQSELQNVLYSDQIIPTAQDKARQKKEFEHPNVTSTQSRPPNVNLPPTLSLTGDILAQGKQLLKPAARREISSNVREIVKPQLPTEQNFPCFSVDANVLQLQKGQLRSVQTKFPIPIKSVAHTLLPVTEDGLPSMANILKKALDDRRFAMGDNPESQDFTPEASWSLQDEEN
ncbi:protein kinase [Plakobranchus ocellatus]|uniref:Protein kinase n=1 Tax=Plakobranchus ocellatus TaxID=259542 RepID=A0AAV4CI77_9GAST|nr:protein kinase [Plakobranchus ocellatus]